MTLYYISENSTCITQKSSIFFKPYIHWLRTRINVNHNAIATIDATPLESSCQAKWLKIRESIRSSNLAVGCNHLTLSSKDDDEQGVYFITETKRVFVFRFHEIRTQKVIGFVGKELPFPSKTICLSILQIFQGTGPAHIYRLPRCPTLGGRGVFVGKPLRISFGKIWGITTRDPKQNPISLGWGDSAMTMCATVKSRVFLGMGNLQPLIGNPYNGAL